MQRPNKVRTFLPIVGLLSTVFISGRGMAQSPLAPGMPTPLQSRPAPQAQRPQPLPSQNVAPRPDSLPACSREENQAFSRSTQSTEEDWIYGYGESNAVQPAYALAINEAMKTLEVNLKDDERVFEREIKRNSTGQTDALVQQDVRVQVEQRKAGCSRDNTCLAPSGSVRVRARCSRYSEMEQNLRKAAEKLAAALPASATVMVLPPTDGGDNVTYLGYQAKGILEQRLQAPLLSPTQKLFVQGKVLSDDQKKAQNPMKIWRERGVTHLVVGETAAMSASKVECRLQLQLAATDEVLPRSLTRFELTLEPQELGKLEIKDRLFPQKAAMDLAGTTGNKGGLEVRLSATKLREGENVEISLRLAEPAYVYVFDIYENGKASLLLPSQALPSNHLEAGRWYTFPDEAWKQAGYILKACPIPGDKINRERIKVLATSKPLDLPLDRYTLNDLADMREGPKGQIAEINQKIEALQRSGVGIATAVAAYDITAVPNRNTGCPKE
jgi:hypothetical protein